MNNLEKHFEEAEKKAAKEIAKYEKEAMGALKKATDISEQYGIPYIFEISNLRNTYTPRSFIQKWSKLSSKFLEEFGLYDMSYDGGWQHSAVC